jgi:hypothetical protein
MLRILRTIMSPRQKRWKVSAQREKARLAGSLEGDWKLAGIRNSKSPETRTRKGGHGRPNLERKRVENEVMYSDTSSAPPSSSSYDSDWSYHESDDSDRQADSDDTEDADPKKPSATRVIIEVEGLKSTLEMNSFCMQCEGRVSAILRTTCIATSIMLKCKDPNCGFIYYSTPPAEIDIEEDNADHRERSTDYAVNVLYVLGFVSCGDGGTEAARILGLLGLPNDTTMQSRSFNIIEDRISSKIQNFTRDLLKENLIEEVKRSTACMNDFDLWRQSIEKNPRIALNRSKYPTIACSFDMGWQQRSSGKVYNSPSGHGLLVGARTRKPIAMVLKSKRCNYCNTWKKKQKKAAQPLPVPDHRCTKNHDSSSSAMEPQSCLDMVISTFMNYKDVVGSIVADDDASTRAQLKWSNADYMRNNKTQVAPTSLISKGKNKGKPQRRNDRGKLPADIPEPIFVADPNHRKKVLTGEFHKLLQDKVGNRFTFTKADATRIGKNFAYMVRQLPRLQESQYENAGKAVLAHHFDDHEFCGPWCRRKTFLARRGAQDVDNNKRFYRSMEKDAVLHSKLQEIVARFITVDRLKEVAHGMDTQANESLNNTFSWLAPKNKVYCGSQSLHNRLSIAVGINMLGTKEYFKRLFGRLGIIMTSNVMHFLSVKARNRTKRIDKSKTSDKKKTRKEAYFETLKANEAVAARAKAKRDGTYKPGQNMNDDSSDDSTRRPTQRQTNRKGPAVCPHCGKKGHKTTGSKKCLFYRGNNSVPVVPIVPPAPGGVVVPTASDVADDADEQYRDDSLPLTDDPPSDISISAFLDDGDMSDDEQDMQSGVL